VLPEFLQRNRVNAIRFPGLQHSLEVPGNNIDFEINLRPCNIITNCRVSQGVRNNIQIKHIALDPVNGKTDTVHANRALPGDVTGERVGCLDPEALGLTFAVSMHDSPDAINMAGNKVATESRAWSQCFFQVNPLSLLKISECRICKSFGRHIGIKLFAFKRNYGKANSVDCNTVTDYDVTGIEGLRVDYQVYVVT